MRCRPRSRGHPRQAPPRPCSQCLQGGQPQMQDCPSACMHALHPVCMRMQGCSCLAYPRSELLGLGLHQPGTQLVCRLPCMLLTSERRCVAAPVRDDAVGEKVVTAADGGQSLLLSWTIAAQQASSVRARDTSNQLPSGIQCALPVQSDTCADACTARHAPIARQGLCAHCLSQRL